MKKDKTQRYHMTSCRDKRSIVRALNNFSNQYDFIYCGKNEVNLAIESFELNYGNKYDDFAFGLTSGNLSEKERNDIQHKLINNKNIIFSNNEAKIDLCNTQLILEAIDNLISINRQEHLKDTLKSVVESKEMNGKNSFFHNEDIALHSINVALNTGEEEEYSDAFIKKLFSQIKNRVKFRRSGVYATNDSASNVVSQKLISIIPTSHIEIIQKQLDFLLQNIDILSIDTKNDFMEACAIYETDNLHPDFDLSYTDFDRNSTFFHPINEYDDEPDLKECAKYSNMPLPLLYRNRDGLYNEEKWNLYHKYEDYEQDVNELTEIMDELISYINDKNELEYDIFMVCTIEESEKFESYQKYRELYTNKQLKRSRTNLIRMLYQENIKDNLYKKISLFEKYFLCEDAVELFQKHTMELSQYGFVFSKKEFLKAFETQKQLFSWYKCRSLQEYKTKFDEIGIDGLLLKWFDSLDMERSYWFDVSMYPCYNHLLPEATENNTLNNEEEFDEEELMREMGIIPSTIENSVIPPEGQSEDSIKINKYPPIPF